MKIALMGEPKEIAALVLAVQERRISGHEIAEAITRHLEEQIQASQTALQKQLFII